MCIINIFYMKKVFTLGECYRSQWEHTDDTIRIVSGTEVTTAGTQDVTTTYVEAVSRAPVT